MRDVRRRLRLLALLLATLLAGADVAMAQAVTTTVQDTIYSANGTPASGSVLVSWSAFTTAGGVAVAAGSTSVMIGAGGLLTIALAPNAGATPMGSYYTVVLHLNDGTTSRQYWVVPVTVPGGGPARLAAIQNQVLPTSVAMQTVSKQYVDTAIAAARTGASTVTITGGTIDGTVIGGTTAAAGSFTTGSFSGNVLLDPTGSSPGAPRIFGFGSFASGTAAQLQFGSAYSAITSQPNDTIFVGSFWGLEMAGNNFTAGAALSAGSVSGASLTVDGPTPGFGATGHILDLKSHSGGTVLGYFDINANEVMPTVTTTASGPGFQEVLYTPASSAASCAVGQFADDANFHYVCVAANTWKRVALSSF